MKNLLLGLILILSLQSFAQGKFRGMSWGTTSSELKSKFPDQRSLRAHQDLKPTIF